MAYKKRVGIGAKGGVMGRPLKEIDQKLFENLCKIHCTILEVCDVLAVDDMTLNNWCRRTYGTTFSETNKRYKSEGKCSLRRWQFKQAENNVAMAIWLGKQYLGQADNPQDIIDNADFDYDTKLQSIADNEGITLEELKAREGLS